MFDASLPGLGDIPMPAPPTAPQPRPGADLALPVTPPHGLIAIYTLLDDKVADFDRAADEVAEQVRANEPDTLVYVIHTVPKAPMQRIFYEVYRDRAAYERHEKQPYVQRFVTARRPYVLATNVIELRLKYAKVSPLPQAEAQAAQAQAAQAQAQTQRPASAPNLPAVRNGNGGRPSGSRPAEARPTESRPSRPRPSGGRPDAPAYPRRDPGNWPRDPGYRPREPREPRDPGYPPRDPRDPGYPPREPRYTPREPDYPDYPSYPPRDREYPPQDPGYPSRRRPPEWSREPRDPYDEPRDRYDESRDRYGEPRDPYPGPRDRYGEPRDPYSGPRDRYGETRDGYDERRDRYEPPPAPRYDRI